MQPGVAPATSRRGKTAYSLPEVLIATVLLAIIASAFYAGLSSGFLVTQAAREDLRATQIMMQKMEGLRLCTWSQLSSYDFKEPYDPMERTNGVGTMYYGRVETNPPVNVPSSVSYWTNLCQVTVTLQWTNMNGRIRLPHERKMQTQVARYGLQNYLWGAIR